MKAVVHMAVLPQRKSHVSYPLSPNKPTLNLVAYKVVIYLTHGNIKIDNSDWV